MDTIEALRYLRSQHVAIARAYKDGYGAAHTLACNILQALETNNYAELVKLAVRWQNGGAA